jgi:hypothetical protein
VSAFGELAEISGDAVECVGNFHEKHRRLLDLCAQGKSLYMRQTTWSKIRPLCWSSQKGAFAI